MRAEICTLREAIAHLVHDGDTVVAEGFTHLIPHAAGHEIIRQGRRDLTLVKMTPDIICDQIIGMGLVQRLRFSWGGNPGVGSLHRFRDAVEHGWPNPIALSERSHADMASAYVAGASRLPFGVLRGYRGTDLPAHNPEIRTLRCPFTGEELAAVTAIRADVALIHAQRADRRGNVQLWGIVGVHKEAVLCADRAIVTVEEIVEDLEPMPDQCILPNWVVSAVCEVPSGAHPSYALGYYERDNRFYTQWDAIARDREAFRAWMQRHVLSTADFAGYLRSVAAAGHGSMARVG
ncbi:MAG: CoA transferase subunit A [Gammaproteobacteria bacterium]|nr:CoA transferase subunit A [Gammaproteobacteria bacterium]